MTLPPLKVPLKPSATHARPPATAPWGPGGFLFAPRDGLQLLLPLARLPSCLPGGRGPRVQRRALRAPRRLQARREHAARHQRGYRGLFNAHRHRNPACSVRAALSLNLLCDRVLWFMFSHTLGRSSQGIMNVRCGADSVLGTTPSGCVNSQNGTAVTPDRHCVCGVPCCLTGFRVTCGESAMFAPPRGRPGSEGLFPRERFTPLVLVGVELKWGNRTI